MENKKTLVLVVGGGGTKGIIPAIMLAALEKKIQEKLNDHSFHIGEAFQYAGGLSIGGLNVVNITIKDKDGKLVNTAADNLKMFNDNAGKILNETTAFSGYITTKISIVPLKNMLSKEWGDTKFVDENFSAKILLESYSLDVAQPTIWTTIGTKEQRAAADNHVVDASGFKIIDVALASAAEPVIFKTPELFYQRSGDKEVKKHLEVDGGMSGSTTPILSLICDIVAMDGKSLRDLCVLSLGCGTTTFDLSYLANSGKVQFAKDFEDILCAIVTSTSEGDCRTAKQLIEGSGGKYFDLTPNISNKIYNEAFDDTVKNSAEMSDVAYEYLNENKEYFNEAADYIASQILMT